MHEIGKLRARLRNVQKNTTEYRMTVVEAKRLLQEIDDLVKQKKEQEQEKPQQVVVSEPAVTTRIIDGGAF